MSISTRRTFVSMAGAAALLGPRRARAAGTKLRFQMSWFAEAELGGYYQAKATGLYDKAGLDVDLLGGGPQVNGVQLLVGGEADMLIGYDIQVFNAIERNLPIRAIAATFQIDLEGLLARPDIKKLAELKGHKIYISGSGNTTYWPWLRQKFGFTDDQIGVKGVNLQTFFADPTSAVAGYITAEPFVAQQQHVPINFLLFSEEGWPTYTNPHDCQHMAFLAANPGQSIRPFLASEHGRLEILPGGPGAGERADQAAQSPHGGRPAGLQHRAPKSRKRRFLRRGRDQRPRHHERKPLGKRPGI